MENDFPGFDLNSPPPTQEEISTWKQELRDRLQFYEFWGQRKIWQGVVALIYLFWALSGWPHPLGEMFSKGLMAVFGALVLSALVDLWVGSQPSGIRKKLYGLSPVDEVTTEAIGKYAAQDPVVDTYLKRISSRPMIWLEYWAINQYAVARDQDKSQGDQDASETGEGHPT